jgi:hypothetical protein
LTGVTFQFIQFQYCVAANSLAAVTYWCQGKTRCEFSPELLLETGYGKTNSGNSIFYIHNFGQPVKDYLEAAQGCSSDNLGTLAMIRTHKEAEKVLELIQSGSNSSRIGLGLDGYWIDAFTKKHFDDLDIIGASGHMQDSCLVLVSNPVTIRL